MYDQREHTISRSSILYGTSADDVWFNLDQFYKDQIQEVNQKLSQLDDEIWCKIVLMEKNKRIAKAYLRTPRFRVDGSTNAFDGQRIGFKSLTNSMRDPMVEEIREKIGVILIKMDQQGNIVAKRCDGSSPVIVQGWDRPEAYCHGLDVTKLRGRLESEKPARVFDMRQFKTAIDREMRQPYPDRKKLLYKSAVRISLVKDEAHPFKTPCWFMLINLVALDMLNANVPPIFTPISSSSASETPISPMSRCQSISSDLQLTGKHLSVSSNDLYFSPALLQPPTVARDVLPSPVWSETYEDLAATTSNGELGSNSNALTTDRLLQAQLANSVALGYSGYGTLARPRWSTSLARSMDCLYGTAMVGKIVEASKSQPTNTLVMDTHNNQRRPEQRKTYATVHHQRCVEANGTLLASDKDKSIYVVNGRGVGRRSTAVISDSESSTSSGVGVGQQQEIYESSSTNSSNSSSGISCRPSSPSIASETASESHHSTDSVFTTTQATVIYNKPATTVAPAPVTLAVPIAKRRSASTTNVFANQRNLSLVSAAPEPPPRPQSLFKNAIRSKLFGLTNGNSKTDTILENKTAALARYNNIQLDGFDRFPTVGAYGVKQSVSNASNACPPKGRITLFQKGSGGNNNASDSDSEVYRL